MENDFDNHPQNKPKHFGLKHKITAIILTPLLIATFISIISLRAEIYHRPQNFKFQHVIAKITKIFTHKKTIPEKNAASKKMRLIMCAIDTYILNTNHYPATLNDLIANPNLTGWCGPYLKQSQLNDPWGRPYIYIPDSNGNYNLISYGEDGKPGGKGYNADIYND